MANPEVLADQGNRGPGPQTYHIPLWEQTNARPATVSLVLSWREGVPMHVSDLVRLLPLVGG